MKKILAIAFLALLLPTGAVADGHEQAQDKPSIAASRTLTLSATVTAIDQATREVTLQGPEGAETTITVGEEVRNLPQVEVGDRVLAEITEEVSIEVFANPEGIEPGAGELMAEARAEAGALPGAAVTDTVIITAVVEAIDLEAQTFALRGPEGNVREFSARNPQNLERAAVGDLVVITITQAVGVIVAHPADD